MNQRIQLTKISLQEDANYALTVSNHLAAICKLVKSTEKVYNLLKLNTLEDKKYLFKRHMYKLRSSKDKRLNFLTPFYNVDFIKLYDDDLLNDAVDKFNNILQSKHMELLTVELLLQLDNEILQLKRELDIDIKVKFSIDKNSKLDIRFFSNMHYNTHLFEIAFAKFVNKL